MTILDMCVIQSQERVVYLTWCGQIPIWTLNSRKGFRGSASNWQNTRTTASSGISCARRTPERSLSLGVTLSLGRKKKTLSKQNAATMFRNGWRCGRSLWSHCCGQWSKQLLRTFGPELIRINRLIKTAQSAVFKNCAERGLFSCGSINFLKTWH